MEGRLGPYILQEPLGAGSMGAVFRARHEVTGKAVALKVIGPGFASNELLVARFQREMAIVQKLMHPHIVRCFETGADGQQRFFVMELIEGGSIATLLERKGKLSWQETIYYARQICSALEYAHQHGVIHRDLKPANLLLDRDRTLKLADFGLALDPDATSLTAAGRTVGTVNYMAPEQVRGKPLVAPQTDLYALGCVMFEMLAGHPPFGAEAPAETMFKQLHTRAPRVSTFVLDCPIWLDKLIVKLLEKEPLQRPSDARIVAQALSRIEERVAAGATMSHAGSDVVSPTLSSRLPRVTHDRPRRKRFTAWPRHKRRLLLSACMVTSLACIGGALWWNEFRTASRAEHLWIDTLRHSHPVVRAEAARALGDLGPASKGAVSALTAALDDSDIEVRANAVRALERIGRAATPAIPKLIRLSKSDESGSVHNLAVQAIQTIRSDGEGVKSIVPWLATVGSVALAALVLFWVWRRLSPVAVPILIEDLKSDRIAVRRRATRILALLGAGANSAVPALLQALKDGDESVRRGAEMALGKIGLENETAIPDLIAALRDRDPFVRTRAAVLLGKCGPAAKAAIPTLIRVLKDPIDLVRVEVVQALGRIDVEAKQAIPHLTDAVRDRSYSVRQAATAVLSKMQSI
jgi:eukaryotic-like serine/threonine-protein kinase